MRHRPHQLFSRIRPFSNLSKREIAELTHSLPVQHFKKGTFLAQQGKTTLKHVYIIQKGSLSIAYQEGNQSPLYGVLKRGDIFGGVSILMNAGLSTRTAQFIENTSVYTISKKTFLDLCKRSDACYRYFVDIFSERKMDESYASVIAASQALHFISTVAPFSFLSKTDLEVIASNLTIHHFPENKRVFVQNQTRVDGLYIIQRGAAERYVEKGSRKILRGVMGEGDVFGGMSMLLNDMIAMRTLRTTEATYCYSLYQKDFFDICDRYEVFSEFFTDTFGKRMLDQSYAAIMAKTGPQRVDMQFVNQPVASITSQNLITCEKSQPIKAAAVTMSHHSCSSIFVCQSNGDIVGVVTDNDFRNKVIAKGYQIDRPISDIMSTPLKTISSQALIVEAVMKMMQNNIKHLAVTDSQNRVVGVVTNQDLLTSQGQSPVFLIRDISTAQNLQVLIDNHNRLPKLIQNLINSGAKAQNINRFITTVSDAILNKIVEFAINELGPPPARFVFMIMGSEGRKEQTLKTDQDNAIVFEDVPQQSMKQVRQYFLRFGEKVCFWLDQAGYAFCDGDVMAKNPRWCQPLSVWKNYFSTWIHTAEAEDLLQASIFFDFRGAFGDMNLIKELRRYLFKQLVGWTGFFRHLTENAVHYKPPIGFFRNFVVESKGAHQDHLDIKRAMMPIVDFARIHALYQKIEETNTLERLNQLHRKRVFQQQEYNELEQAYSFLMQLRFIRQVTAVLDDKDKPSNYLNPKKLSGIEQKMLKEIFKKIENVQSQLSFTFTGLPSVQIEP